MELKFRLLEHPFYQAWTMGEVTEEQLAKYHASYKEFIELMPKYWDKICKSFDQNGPAAQHVINEEQEHIALWDMWSGKLPQTDEFPRMAEVIDAFNQMTPSELLGAVHAFEVQQPEVAITKKKGLLEHYGYNEAETLYFDEHINEEEHIALGRDIAENFANKAEFERGFEKGSELVYRGLDLFLN